jgi:putative ABC transport system permease protein
VLSLRLALHALRWRGVASIMVFAVALVGIAAAAVGPIYLHAVDATVLAHRLTRAPQNERDLRIDRQTTVGDTEVNWHTAVLSLATRAADARWFDDPVFSEEAPVVWHGATNYDTELAALDSVCAHIRLVAGRCLADTSLTDAVVTERTAQAQHLKVGQVLDPVAGTGVRFHVRIVGVAAPIDPHGQFWTPWDYLNAAGNIADNRNPRLDAFLVSHRLLSSHQYDVSETITANLRLRTNKIHLADLDALRTHITQLQAAAEQVNFVTAGSMPVVGSGLPSVLDAMDQEMSLAQTLVILPTAQLVLLAIFVLYVVVAGTAAATGHEVALAKLRGLRTVLAQGLAPPVLLVVAAAPIASALAWLVVKLVAGHLLGPGTDVAFPIVAVEVVIAATAASAVAAAIAARRIIVSPVGQLLRRGGDPVGSSLGLALTDAATIALAAAGVVELAATGATDSGRTNPLSAVAAIMLGAAIGVIVVRLLPVLGRTLVRSTRESSRLATFLAVRQIVRRPAGARVIVLVGVALALATFAIVNWSVAASNRQQRALTDAGADTVLLVHADRAVTDLRTVVDRADPDGHSMAAAVVRVDRSTPLLAVDTARFSGVAAWPDHNSSSDLTAVLAGLVPSTRPSIALPQPELRLDVDATKLPGTGVRIQLRHHRAGEQRDPPEHRGPVPPAVPAHRASARRPTPGRSGITDVRGDRRDSDRIDGDEPDGAVDACTRLRPIGTLAWRRDRTCPAGKRGWCAGCTSAARHLQRAVAGTGIHRYPVDAAGGRRLGHRGDLPG